MLLETKHFCVLLLVGKWKCVDVECCAVQTQRYERYRQFIQVPYEFLLIRQQISHNVSMTLDFMNQLRLHALWVVNQTLQSLKYAT